MDTIAFYEKAFGFSRSFVTDTQEYGELETGDTKLAFVANSFAKGLTNVPFEAASPDKNAPPFELGLVTETVEEDFERPLASGYSAWDMFVITMGFLLKFARLLRPKTQIF